MAKVSLQHLMLPQAKLSFKSPHCSVHVCLWWCTPAPEAADSAHWGGREMSHTKASSHKNFCSRSSAVVFPLLSRNWHIISSRNSKHLFSTFLCLTIWHLYNTARLRVFRTTLLEKRLELAMIQTFGSYKVNYLCYCGHNMLHAWGFATQWFLMYDAVINS